MLTLPVLPVVGLLAAAAIGISEVAFFAEDHRTVHLVLFGQATAMAAFCAFSICTEYRAERGFQFRITASDTAVALLLGWLMHFFIFLCLATLGTLIAAASSVVGTGSAQSLESLVTRARKLGAACLFVSLIPPFIMGVAVKLGFRLRGDA